MLLATVDTAAASEARRGILEPYRYRNPLREYWERDPCLFNMLWGAETSGPCLERADVSFGTKLNLSKAVALDPATVFPTIFIEQASQAEFDFDPAQICNNTDGVTSEDHSLKNFEPTMCATAPQRIAEFERYLAHNLKYRQAQGRRLLAFRVFEHLIIMQPEERRIIVDSWRAILQESDGSVDDRFAESVLFQCALWGAKATDQLDLWLQRHGRNNYSPGYTAPVAPIGRCLANRMAELLRTMDDDSVRFNLLMLLDGGLSELTDTLRATLLALCRNAGARFAFGCRRIFLRLGDGVGAGHIIAGGAEFLEPDAILNDPSASLLVCKFGVDLPFDVVVDRVATRFLGLAVDKRGRVHAEILHFGGSINATLERTERAVGEVPSSAASAIIEVDWCGLNDFDLDWDLRREPQRTLRFLSLDSDWGGIQAGTIGRQNLGHFHLRKR